MSSSELEPKILGILCEVAPDVDPAALKRDQNFRDQFDFDSMDTLNFAIGLHRAFGIEIPEVDYGQLAGLAKASDYVRRKLGAGGPEA